MTEVKMFRSDSGKLYELMVDARLDEAKFKLACVLKENEKLSCCDEDQIAHNIVSAMSAFPVMYFVLVKELKEALEAAANQPAQPA